MASLLMETALKAALLLGVSALAALLLRRSAARLRVAVWTAALGGILLLPLAASLLPELPVRLPGRLPLSLSWMAMQSAAGPPRTPADGLAPPAPAAPVASVTGGAAAASPAADAGPRRALPHFAPRLGGATGCLLALWLAGAALVLGRVAVDGLRIRRLLARSRPAPADWAPLLAVARRQVGCRRGVRLRVCDELAVPATVGVRRPAILLPATAGLWSGERRALVLRHELIHVARLDWGWRILAGLACAAHWFDPLAWWASRRLALEQELACDQEVVAGGVLPSLYAVHLLEIARGATRQPVPAASLLGMARPTHLEERIMAILNGRTRGRAGIATAAAAALALLLVVPVLAAMEAVTPTAPASAAASVPASVAPRPAAPAPEAPPVEPAPPAEPAPPPAPAELEAPDAPPAVQTADPELARLIRQLSRLEARLQQDLKPVQDLEQEMRPHLKRIEHLDASVDQDALRRLERQARQLDAQAEALRPQMDALAAEIEDLGRQLEQELGGTDLLPPRERRAARTERVREIRQRMRPYLEAMLELEQSLAPLRERLDAARQEMEFIDQSELKQIQEAVGQIEPLTAQVGQMTQDLQPLIGRIEDLARRLEAKLTEQVEAILRRHLEPVTDSSAPFAAAAEELVAEKDGLHVDDETVRLNISERVARRIIDERFASSRRGGRGAFQAAAAAASREVSRLEIRAR